jgi:protein fantom
LIGTILDKLTNERQSYDSINTEHRQLQIKYYEIKQKYDDLNEKLKFLNQETNIDFDEIEEALILVKERKKQKKVDFCDEYETNKADHLKRKLTDMEVQIADTVRELDKTRHLLLTQVKINDDYKKEVTLIQTKMEDNKMEYDRKMLEYAQLLDIRSARIKKLERQLKDIAYGTKQVRVGSIEDGAGESSAMAAIDDATYLNTQQVGQLERGQNIFEIHITRVVLNADAAKLLLNETDPALFCTIEFYEHELQTTPIMKGFKLDFNFTSQYIIKIDDFFLYYLQKHVSTIELHQAVGSDYRTLAACSISFKDLIENNVPRTHGTLKLISILDNSIGSTVGVLDYWVRLLMPIDQAFRLYKERTKALGKQLLFRP